MKLVVFVLAWAALALGIAGYATYRDYKHPCRLTAPGVCRICKVHGASPFPVCTIWEDEGCQVCVERVP